MLNSLYRITHLISQQTYDTGHVMKIHFSHKSTKRSYMLEERRNIRINHLYRNKKCDAGLGAGDDDGGGSS